MPNFRRRVARMIYSRNEETQARWPSGMTAMGQFNADDLFIIGFPKSGHTWCQNLVAEAVYGFTAEVISNPLVNDLVPDIHFHECYRRYRSPMFFKAHSLPQREFRRVIYLMRDGRDAMVSYLHFLEAMEKRKVDFLSLVRTGEGLFPCKWHEHVLQWKANPFKADVLPVRYEDLKADTLKELQRMMDFAGIARTRAQLENAVQRSSFGSMQKREKELGLDSPNWPREKLFVRRGEVGSHADEMPLAVQQAFMAEAGPAMREMGYIEAGS
jgi:hypothetical protein